MDSIMPCDFLGTCSVSSISLWEWVLLAPSASLLVSRLWPLPPALPNSSSWFCVSLSCVLVGKKFSVPPDTKYPTIQPWVCLCFYYHSFLYAYVWIIIIGLPAGFSLLLRGWFFNTIYRLIETSNIISSFAHWSIQRFKSRTSYYLFMISLSLLFADL